MKSLPPHENLRRFYVINNNQRNKRIQDIININNLDDLKNESEKTQIKREVFKIRDSIVCDMSQRKRHHRAGVLQFISENLGTELSKGALYGLNGSVSTGERVVHAR